MNDALALRAGAAVSGFVGPVLASLLHDVGTLVVLANAGRLLKFDEPRARSAHTGGAPARGDPLHEGTGYTR